MLWPTGLLQAVQTLGQQVTIPGESSLLFPFFFFFSFLSLLHYSYTVSCAGSEGFLNLLSIYMDHILYPTITDSAFYTEVFLYFFISLFLYFFISLCIFLFFSFKNYHAFT